MKKVAVILIIIGLVMTIYTTLTIFTKEKIVDAGRLEITRNKPHRLKWSPLIGIAIMGVGGVVLWQVSKKQ